MFYLRHEEHHANHSGCNSCLPPKWTQFLALTLVLLGFTGWVASPGYTSSRSAPSRFSASGQMTPQGINFWTNNGPEGATIISLAIDPGNPNTIYAGTYDGRVFKSTDGGGSWSTSNTGPTGDTVAGLVIDPSNSNIIYAVSELKKKNTVFKSTDGGASWNAANTGLNNEDVGVVVIGPSDPNILYAGAAPGVFKSTNGGASWNRVSNFFGLSLAIDPVSSDILYALSLFDIDGDYVLFKSTNGGVNWNELKTDLTDGPNVRALAIDPRNTNTIYVGDAYESGGIAKSTDGGASWSVSHTGLPNVPVSPLVIDSVNTATIYAGTGRGVFFRSTDGGGSWSPLNNGLPNLDVYVYALVIDHSGTYLHAGTGAGVFDYQVSASCDYSISSASQSFEPGGGAGSVNVTAGNECSWTATAMNSRWISFRLQVRNPNGSLSQEFVFGA